jgi:hypothetical protein
MNSSPSLAAVVACLLIATNVVLAAEPTAQPATEKQPTGSDLYADPLPPLATARLGTLRFRPGARVGRIRFAPDGRTLLTIDRDQVAWQWETTTGKEQFHRRLPSDPVVRWLFTPDGRTLLTAPSHSCGAGWPRSRRWRHAGGWNPS